jgi:hypothetical protein
MKAEKEVKVKIIPLLCWDIYSDYLEEKMGNRKDDYFPPKRKRAKMVKS